LLDDGRICLKWSSRSTALLYGRILSGVLVLVVVRAVVADVQPAVQPVRVSPQDVAARLPAATANVRAFVDFSLGNIGHLFMMSDEDLVCWATSKIMFSVLDEIAQGWRGSATDERRSYSFLWRTSWQLLLTWTFFSIALAWNSRMLRRREPQLIASRAFIPLSNNKLDPVSSAILGPPED
jgi:hypothetical protein